MSDVTVRRLFIFASVCAFAAATCAAWMIFSTVNDPSRASCVSTDAVTVALDAGHGGEDPGCVFEGVRESEINLDISMRLKELLTQKGFVVVCVRENEEGVKPEGVSDWEKTADMLTRKKIILGSGAQMCISIHQNAYSDTSCRGAQVFYNGCSENNEKLAALMREQLAQISPVENDRTELRNDSLYMLKENPIPSVLIECGFLSNDEERALLSTEEYRGKIADAIYKGVCIYFDVPY